MSGKAPERKDKDMDMDIATKSEMTALAVLVNKMRDVHLSTWDDREAFTLYINSALSFLRGLRVEENQYGLTLREAVEDAHLFALKALEDDKKGARA